MSEGRLPPWGIDVAAAWLGGCAPSAVAVDAREKDCALASPIAAGPVACGTCAAANPSFDGSGPCPAIPFTDGSACTRPAMLVAAAPRTRCVPRPGENTSPRPQ